MSVQLADRAFDVFARAQPAAAAALKEAVASDAVAHAWLLLGPPGSGQVEAARYLGAALNCEADDARASGVPCGVCGTCRRIREGVHTAVLDFAPEGTQHRVADVRDEWIPAATRSAMEGRFKVLRIEAAERMNETAQNAFLKLLEEPPPSVVWVLDAADDAALLDTIISRCRRLDVRPWPRALLRERLDGWIEAGDGDPGRGSGHEVTSHASTSSKKKVDEVVHLDPPVDAECEALVRLAKGSPQLLGEMATCDGRRLRQAAVTVVGRILDVGGKAAGGIAPSLVNEVLGASAQTGVRLAAAHQQHLFDLGDSLGVEMEWSARGEAKPKRGSQWPPGVLTAENKRAEREQREAMVHAHRRWLDLLRSYLQDLLVVATAPADALDEAALLNVDRVDALRREAPRIDLDGLVDAMAAIERGHLAFDLNGNPKLQLERAVVQVVLACARG